MGIKKHLKPLLNHLKSSTSRSNKRLLFAAVILFTSLFALISPVKGADQLLFAFFDKQPESDFVENMEDTIPYLKETLANNETYLTANTLATITTQTQEEYIDETDLVTWQGNALLDQSIPITTISQESRNEAIEYTVQEGDMPSTIAAKFGISLNTLLWANSLKETSVIKPGDELTILPVNGLVHRVKNGDTIGAIATKYKANTEKIIAFNDLPADGKISINEKLIIPDGQMPVVKTTSYVAKRTYTTGPGTGKSRAFPYGQCTWYVAQKRVVTWSGHAKSWLVNARAAGYSTGSTPKVGAIMVMTEGGWMGRRYGHVAYVESINGSWITISEMNYTGWARKSVRTLKANDWRIRGYVY